MPPEPGFRLRVLRSILDRTFAIKLFNRFSHVRYVPAPEAELDQFLEASYPSGDWRRLSPQARRAWVDYSPIMDGQKIRTIAYVGAHDGTIPLALDDAFPGREFFLLEPAPRSFEVLVANAVHRQNVRCFNVAAGPEDTNREMFVDDFSPASSLLPYETTALQEFPFLGHGTTAQVHVRPLDHVLRDCAAGVIDMLHMDVQGYEDEVLRGATITLASCKVVVSELSLHPLYRGSSMFDSVYRALVPHGFRLRYLLNPLEGVSRRILQVDGVFIRD